MASSNAAEALADVHARIGEACAEVGRDPSEVVLIAVSKTFPADVIAPVLEAGHRHFGENRVQESQAKWPELKAQFPGTVLHLLGPLQSNKAKDAVALFDVIHSVDRPKIAKALADEMTAQGRTLDLFVQVNVGLEDQKAGVDPKEVADFLAYCRGDCGLAIKGLMCIPPVEDAPAPHFKFLKSLAEKNSLPDAPPLALSMGMSADYDVAVQFGATHVRVGSAIFGARG
jgi:pyridoxal phosphate enzyme (YggS family)